MQSALKGYEYYDVGTYKDIPYTLVFNDHLFKKNIGSSLYIGEIVPQEECDWEIKPQGEFCGSVGFINFSPQVISPLSLSSALENSQKEKLSILCLTHAWISSEYRGDGYYNHSMSFLERYARHNHDGICHYRPRPHVREFAQKNGYGLPFKRHSLVKLFE